MIFYPLDHENIIELNDILRISKESLSKLKKEDIFKYGFS